MKKQFKNLNLPDPIPLGEPGEMPERNTINVHGRKEHEAILKDPARCEELGIDRIFETAIYLKRWGGWIENDR